MNDISATLGMRITNKYSYISLILSTSLNISFELGPKRLILVLWYLLGCIPQRGQMGVSLKMNNTKYMYVYSN